VSFYGWKSFSGSSFQSILSPFSQSVPCFRHAPRNNTISYSFIGCAKLEPRQYHYGNWKHWYIKTFVSNFVAASHNASTQTHTPQKIYLWLNSYRDAKKCTNTKLPNIKIWAETHCNSVNYSLSLPTPLEQNTRRQPRVRSLPTDCYLSS